MAEQRLQKILAAAGIASRRKCEQMILDGQVRVNRKLVDTLPAFADPHKDIITANGRKIRIEPKVYFLLNKPKGVICTSSDPQGRKKAIDLVNTPFRIFCVGRLDVDSSGLIVLTNDSELANKLTHPRYELPKTCEVEVKGPLNPEAVEKLKKGVWLAEKRTAKISVKVLRKGQKFSKLQITIREGLNRQVRRMLARVDLPVKSLKRSKVGRLELRGVGIGKSRPLTKAELAYLKKITAK